MYSKKINTTFVCVLILTLLNIPMLSAQAAVPPPRNPASTPIPTTGTFTADSLTPETEELTFLGGLRRFEIIAFGTLPFTLLFANLGYSIGRYLYYGFSEGFASTNAQTRQPELFNTTAFSEDEKGWLLLGAISGSLLIALIDIIIEGVKVSAGQP